MCEVEGCQKPHHARNLCSRHYANLRRCGNPVSDADRSKSRRGCAPSCTCGRHTMTRTKVSSLPCLHCGKVRAVAFCDGPKGNTPEKFCDRACYRDWNTNRREARRSTTGVAFIYDMSGSEFEGRLIEQRGQCAICARKIGKDAHRDHCHESGKWRGLLCGSCNRGLGLFGDDPDVLLAAAFYLTKTMDVIRIGTHYV